MVDTVYNVLLAVPTPPPYSGPEINGELLLKIGLWPDFRIHHLRTNVNSSNKTKGSVGITKLVTLVALWLRLVLAMFRYRPKIVYLYLSQNRAGFLRDALVIIIAWIFGAKVIAHVRGSNFENFYRYVEPAFQRLIRFVIKRLTLVILLAERFRVQFRGLLPDDRIRVLYNAVDTHLFDDDKPRRLEDDITLTVLFIGHLSAAKGFLDVLKAAPQVLRAVPSLAFSFAGEWLEAEKNILYDEAGHRLEHDSKAIRQLWSELQHWYDGRLRYLGVLTRLEVVAVIKAAHIFVLPSYSEGFPMAVLEAMAGGLPMVVTPVGTLAEVLEDGVNCIFVSPGDVDALAKALIELANRPELRERIGQANRELVRIRFSMEAMAERLSSFFKECLA